VRVLRKEREEAHMVPPFSAGWPSYTHSRLRAWQNWQTGHSAEQRTLRFLRTARQWVRVRRDETS